MLLISGIRIPLHESNDAAFERAAKLIGIPRVSLKSETLRKLSYDARHGQITKVCSVVLALENKESERKIAQREKSASLYEAPKFSLKRGQKALKSRPVVIGFGPAGMFAALALAEYGFCPIVLERGRDVDRRREDVAAFFSSGAIHPESNVQFGEGGAGTFSDGKLTTRINDPLCDYILRKFVEFGAPESILYESKPHIGTDLLGGIIKNIRKRIIECGGEVRFESRVEDVSVREGKLASVTVNGEKLFCETAILATGHSSRDIFSLLHARGAELSAKSFAVGLRIEHLQSDIDRCLWGKAAGDPLLPKGEYALSTNVDGRAVYTFCMCPGGSVVAASSGAHQVVVNGMSRNAREGKNANSAVVVAVDESDFSSDPFAAIEFQKRLEREAFLAGGGQYAAPASDVGSFLLGRAGLETKGVQPSYPLGVRPFDLGALLGEKLADPLRMGILSFSEKIRCFDNSDAILTGVESRTSSPVRIVRGEDRQAKGIENLYPSGEGAGYAGGIMSSAVDGLKTAATIIEKYSPSA